MQRGSQRYPDPYVGYGDPHLDLAQGDYSVQPGASGGQHGHGHDRQFSTPVRQADTSRSPQTSPAAVPVVGPKGAKIRKKNHP